MHGSARVRFTDKLKKLVTGHAFESAAYRVRRFARRRRSAVPLNAEEIIATIDREQFEEIRARHWMDDPGEEPPKYLELPVWIEANLKRIRDLELDVGRSRRILDIGSGNGYFVYICGLLGHDAIGMDIDEMPMFNEMIELLGVKRRVWRVQPFVPLPNLGGLFDVVTAHQICFNGHKSDQLWGVAEWDFFLNDLSRHLSDRGRIWFEFNREFDGTCYSEELKEFFESRGAETNSNRVIFNEAPRVRVGAAPASP
jgi:SAM-dependent methyltransferase